MLVRDLDNLLMDIETAFKMGMPSLEAQVGLAANPFQQEWQIIQQVIKCGVKYGINRGSYDGVPLASELDVALMRGIGSMLIAKAKETEDRIRASAQGEHVDVGAANTREQGAAGCIGGTCD